MLWIIGQDKRKIQTTIRQMPQVHTSDSSQHRTCVNRVTALSTQTRHPIITRQLPGLHSFHPTLLSAKASTDVAVSTSMTCSNEWSKCCLAYDILTCCEHDSNHGRKYLFSTDQILSIQWSAVCWLAMFYCSTISSTTKEAEHCKDS